MTDTTELMRLADDGCPHAEVCDGQPSAIAALLDAFGPRSEWDDWERGDGEPMGPLFRAAEAEAAALRWENERLRAALKPFAELGERWNRFRRDYWDVPMPNSGSLTVGDCRRAAELLAELDGAA